MKRVLIGCTLIACALFQACAPSDDERATQFISEAKQAYNRGDYATARAAVDSVERLFPSKVAFRRQGDTIMWHIDYNTWESERPHRDSLLEERCKEAEVLAKNFRLAKNEKYQEIGDYEHNLLRTERNTGRTYVKAVADEAGKFTLSSNYIGSALEHNQLIASSGELSAETAAVGEAQINSYGDDMGNRHETTLFNADEAADFIAFIVQHAAEPIKVTLVGKRNYTYTLGKNDKQAIVDTYHLSEVLRDVAEMQRQKALGDKKQQLLIEKLNKPSAEK